MSISIQLNEKLAVFHDNDRIAGEYVLDDPFKPYFRTLNTPAGHNLTAVFPVDHRHHKGLMFALVAEDVCWWEEEPGRPSCGVQEILTTKTIDNGITQELLWRAEDGGLETYRESRGITLERTGSGSYRWRWQSRRESLRDHHLKKSKWSSVLPDGRRINYHGLGIRLPWAWAFGPEECPWNGVEIEGNPSTAAEACGMRGASVTWWGLIDGYWSPPKAAVTIEQERDYTWFLIKNGFAYLSVGPSNAEELAVAKGTVFDETYFVTAADRS